MEIWCKLFTNAPCEIDPGSMASRGDVPRNHVKCVVRKRVHFGFSKNGFPTVLVAVVSFEVVASCTLSDALLAWPAYCDAILRFDR